VARWVGSLKWQVSFAECSLFYRALLHDDVIHSDLWHDSSWNERSLLQNIIFFIGLFCMTMWFIQICGMTSHATSLNVLHRHAKEPYKRDYILQKRPIISWRVMAQVWMSKMTRHATDLNELHSHAKELYKRDHILQKRPIISWLVMPQIWISYKWRVMSLANKSCHMGMSHVTYEWVMSHGNGSCHRCMQRVTWMN